MRLGFGEVLVVFVIVLLVFGPGKLPQLGDALGKGIRSFRKAAAGLDSSEASGSGAEPPKLTMGAPGVSATTGEARKA